jgi:hypothetical protein
MCHCCQLLSLNHTSIDISSAATGLILEAFSISLYSTCRGFRHQSTIREMRRSMARSLLLRLQNSLRFLRSDLGLLILRTTAHHTMDQVNGSFVPHCLMKAWPAEPKEDRSWNLHPRITIVFSKSPPLDLMELTLLSQSQECSSHIPTSHLSSLDSWLTTAIL